MHKRTVLFLCSANSARSQMAEAFLRHLAGDRFEVVSAGLAPTGVHPLTTKVMDEQGIDVSGQTSKGVSQFLGKMAAHYVVFVCDRAERDCPTIWPSALQRLSWPFEDPAACDGTQAEQLAKFRQVRDEIRRKIEAWLAEMPPEAEEKP